MAHAGTPAAADIWIGAPEQGTRTVWLSPVLIGVAAPLIFGLILAPQFLDGAGPVVATLLALLLLLAGGAYVLSIVAPGAPRAMKVQTDTQTVVLLRHGLVANSELAIAFSEVARVSLTSGAYRDGFGTSGIEILTRSGERWALPADVGATDIANLRRVIGVRGPSR